MTVSFVLYAAVKDAAGSGRVSLPVPEGATLRHALDALTRKHPETAPFRAVMRGAIDDAYVSEHEPLPVGAEIHVITPVSGG